MAVPRRVLAEQPRGVMRSMKILSGLAIRATDGRIGKVDDFYFDDISWTLRYVVVDTGGWLTGRQVLISPAAVLKPEWERNLMPVDLTREQIENSPGIASDAPVSKQHEIEMYKYYGWPPYWTGGTTPVGAVPPAVYSLGPEDREKGDPNLRSSNEVINYGIQAADGKIGHVEDFLVDDQSWIIRYMVVDTRDWLPGRNVLVAVNWIKNIEWAKSSVFVQVSKETIKKAPDYLSPSDITPEYEERLFRYYNLPGYWI
jgi:uncharacterized protein YrrD